MEVKHGAGATQYGPGVSISLSGDEVATAIDAWLVARGVHVAGPRTVTVNGAPCAAGHVYVDPSGFVIADGQKLSGRGARASAPTDGTAAVAALPASRLSPRMALFLRVGLYVAIMTAVCWYLVANWPHREYGGGVDVHGSADVLGAPFDAIGGRA